MARKPNEATYAPELEKLYGEMEITRTVAVDDAARKCIRLKSRYLKVAKQTGVPWEWLAVIHMRESNNNFAGVLHNGEKIIGSGRKTKLVPRGRGPFPSWEEAAIDALAIKKLVGLPKATWTLGKQLYEAERFNGFGYFNKGKRSPYVWAGSSMQQRGKFIRDHVYSASTMDTQLGVAPVLKRIGELERTKSVPKGKTAKKVRTMRRTVEGVFGAIGVWLSQFYENLTIDNIVAYATDPTVLAVFAGGLVLWIGLKSLDSQVVKAYREGNYYTNEELEMDDAELAD